MVYSVQSIASLKSDDWPNATRTENPEKAKSHARTETLAETLAKTETLAETLAKIETLATKNETLAEVETLVMKTETLATETMTPAKNLWQQLRKGRWPFVRTIIPTRRTSTTSSNKPHARKTSVGSLMTTQETRPSPKPRRVDRHMN
jgi:hypothetical protein